MKGGTTTLHDLLKQHNQILLPSVQKELRFFDVDENYRKGLAWYEEFFSQHSGQRAIGEIAPTYAYREDVPERIAKDLGCDLKLIFSLRNPIDRAYSHYMMNCLKQYETLEFSKAIAREPERLIGAFPERLRFGYLDQGRYTVQIKRFMEVFPREKMMFLLFETDLLRNRREAVTRIYHFLGVDAVEINLDVWSYAAQPTSLRRFPALSALNRIPLVKRVGKSEAAHALKSMLKRQIEPKLAPDIRRLLFERHFASEMAELEPLIGRNLDIWHPAKVRS
jgi:hypothetical protein